MILILSAVLALTNGLATAQLTSRLTTEPDSIELIYSDVLNFINFIHALESTDDTLVLLKKEYLDKASPGLMNFMLEKDKDADDYKKAITTRPETYRKLVDLPEALQEQEDSIIHAMTSLKEVIPEAIFMPFYYMVGPFKGAMGEPSEHGIMIVIGELDKDLFDLSALMVHETVHVQQALTVGIEEYHRIYGPDMTLLSLAIREGTAYYLTLLATGKHTNEDAYNYLIEHEKELWDEFRNDMSNGSPGDWMWKKPADPEKPRDLGYVLGAMIIKSYYDRAEDKQQAITDILSIRDYEGFFEKSGYGNKFED